MRCLAFTVLFAFSALAPAAETGQKYAVLIAVSDYQEASGLKPLPFTVKDVEGFRGALLATGYQPANVWVLHDKLPAEKNPGFRFVPKKNEIVTELGRALGLLDAADSVVVVLNGHGVHFKGEKTSHFCPLDADLNTKKNLIPMDGPGGLYPMLETCKAKSKLLIAGMCRNDPKDFPADSQAADKIDLTSPETPPAGIAALYSCEAGQKTYFDPKAGSYFFKHLTAAWRGEYADDELTLDGVFESVRAKTKREVFAVSKGLKDQYPEVRRKYDGAWVVQPADLVRLAKDHRDHERGLLCERQFLSFGKEYARPHTTGICFPPKNWRGAPDAVARQAEWLRLATEGRPTAMTLTGVALNTGVGKDAEAAVKWFGRAAEAGDALAMCDLAFCLAGGGGVPKDEAAAMKWFLRAGDAGCVKAMTWLGSGYAGGWWGARDDKEALKWALRAADLGHCYVLNELAESAMTGETAAGKVPKDEKQAVTLFRLSAEKGDTLALCLLGAAHWNGTGVDADDAKALALFQQAADAGDPNGMICLAFCHLHGRGVDMDAKKAAEWFRQAKKANDISGEAKRLLKELGEE